MFIDYFSERSVYAGGNFVLAVIFYFSAALIALLLRYYAQARCRKKNGVATPIHHTILDEGASALWNVLFFLLTGCLKGTVRETHRTAKEDINRKIFITETVAVFGGAALSFLLYTVFQLLLSVTGADIWGIFLLATEALTAAHMSLLIFTCLPLPGSDADVYLRKGELSKRGKAFRRNGVWPFFLFCILGLFLSCFALPVKGQYYSLSSIITLFPIFLIGG